MTNLSGEDAGMRRIKVRFREDTWFGNLRIPKGAVFNVIESYAEWLLENAPVELAKETFVERSSLPPCYGEALDGINPLEDFKVECEKCQLFEQCMFESIVKLEAEVEADK